MSRVCEVCGKKTTYGNQITRRGKAKYLGGVGRKITGISRRTFRPNLQNVRAVVDGEVRRLRVCTQCIRGGKLVKPAAGHATRGKKSHPQHHGGGDAAANPPATT
jgi:large subunit ribosomal protein L28